MKKIFYLLTGILVLSIFNQPLFSQIGYGFSVGFSTPSDQINNIYNGNNINIRLNNQDVLGNLANAGSKAGYNIGAGIRFPLSSNFLFRGGIALHRFPLTKLDVYDPSDLTKQKPIATLSTTQNIVPITIGLNFYLFREILGIYATGDLSYNYIASTVDATLPNTSVPVPINNPTPTDNRVGFGIGAGVDFDIKLLLLNLEAKYNVANMIGQKAGETTKSYFSLDLGVYFGSSK